MMSHKTRYMACVWPVAGRENLEVIENELQSVGKILFSKDIFLGYLGMRNFLIQIYGHQSWCGTVDNRYRGINEKLHMCFMDGQPIRTYLFEAESLEAVVEAKERIRGHFRLKKHSIHISDSESETNDMIRLLYNENSLQFLNVARPYQYKGVNARLQDIKKSIEEKGLDKDRFILGEGAVLELYGIQEAKDVFFLTDYHPNEIAELHGVTSYDEKERIYGQTISQILNDSKNYFYFSQMKVVSLECLLKANEFLESTENSKRHKLYKMLMQQEQHPTMNLPVRAGIYCSRCFVKMKEAVRGLIGK